MSTSNKGEENKEENPLLTRGFAFSFGKQGGKSSAHHRVRIFLRKTRRIRCFFVF